MLTTGAPVRRRVRRSRRPPGQARSFGAGQQRARPASRTRSTMGSRAGGRTAAPACSRRPGLLRGPRSRVESPPFAPHPQLDVRLAQSGRELFDLGFELGLAFGARSSRVVASRQALEAGVGEQFQPLRDRGLRQLKATGDLDLGHLATQHRHHRRQLLVRATNRFTTHPASLVSPMPFGCPRKSDARHGFYSYDWLNNVIDSTNFPNNPTDYDPFGEPEGLATFGYYYG